MKSNSGGFVFDSRSKQEIYFAVDGKLVYAWNLKEEVRRASEGDTIILSIELPVKVKLHE